jgi:hypothetical protein
LPDRLTVHHRERTQKALNFPAIIESAERAGATFVRAHNG